jgi:hypothetical protein
MLTLNEIRGLIEISWTAADRQYLLTELESHKSPEAQELREQIRREENPVVLEQCPYEGGRR